MAPNPANGLQPVTLRLPAGEGYRLELSPEELAALLAPDRKPLREHGMSAVHVERHYRGGHAAIALSPGELTHLLSRARLETEAGTGRPPQPDPMHDPSKGRAHGRAGQVRGGVKQPPGPVRRGPERHHRHP